jgi:hypothetical protein
MKSRGWFAMIAVTALLLICPALHADAVGVSLSTVSGAVGSTVDVVGTITNNTDGLLFLNGDSFSLVDSSLTLDDSDFFDNAPLTLNPGASSDPFDIFVIEIGSSATPGVLSPNFFSVLGGSDPGSSDVIGTVTFDVDVQGVTPVPEPSGLLLLACGIASILAIRRGSSLANAPCQCSARGSHT